MGDHLDTLVDGVRVEARAVARGAEAVDVLGQVPVVARVGVALGRRVSFVFGFGGALLSREERWEVSEFGIRGIGELSGESNLQS